MVKDFCFGWHPVNDGAAPVNEGGGRWCEHPLRSSLFRGRAVSVCLWKAVGRGTIYSAAFGCMAARVALQVTTRAWYSKLLSQPS